MTVLKLLTTKAVVRPYQSRGQNYHQYVAAMTVDDGILLVILRTMNPDSPTPVNEIDREMMLRMSAEDARMYFESIRL